MAMRPLPTPAPIRLAAQVMTATLGALALLLSIWLLQWLRPAGSTFSLRGYWLASGEVGPEARAARAAHRAAATDINEGVAQKLSRRIIHPLSSRPGDLPAEIRGFLDEQGRLPAIVFLSASGILGDDPSTLRLAAPGLFQSRAEIESVRLEDLIEVFQAESAARRKRVLILDIGPIQPGSDPDLATQMLLERLLELVPVDPPEDWWGRGTFAVLCSSAPWQFNGLSEAEGQTAFSFFVTEALSGQAITFDQSIGPSAVRIRTFDDLVRYVRGQVEEWADTSNSSIQTPILLGDASLNFRIPPLDRSSDVTARLASEEDSEATVQDAITRDLRQHFARRDAIEAAGQSMAGGPAAVAPFHWQQYQAQLLIAERLFRLGNPEECAEVLTRVEEIEGRLTRLLSPRQGQPTDAEPPLPSLALEARYGPLGTSGLLSSNRAEQWKEQRTRWLTPDPRPIERPAPEPGTADDAPLPPPAEPPRSRDPVIVTDHVEGRLLEWANRLQDPPPLPEEQYPLKWTPPSREELTTLGRGAVLEQILSVRGRIEQAAALPWRINRWVKPLVEEADERLRRSQDLWLAAPSGRDEDLTEARRLLGEAERAVDNALRCGQAFELLQAVRSEARFLLLGKLRLDLEKPTSVSFPQIVDGLLDPATQVADLIEGPADRSKLTILLQYEDQLRKAYNALRDELGKPRRIEGDRVPWRELDLALSVPFLSADIRTGTAEQPGGLLTATIEAAGRERLRVASEDVAGTSPDSKSTTKELGKTVVEGRGLGQLARSEVFGSSSQQPKGLKPALSNEFGPPEADPHYWTYARGWLLIEHGLLKLASLSHSRVESYTPADFQDLQRFNELGDRLRRRPELDGLGLPPDDWREALVELARGIEQWWKRLSATLEDHQQVDLHHMKPELLINLLGIASSLPPRGNHPAAAAESRMVPELTRFSLMETLLWSADRWLRDADSRSAAVAIDLAGRLGAPAEVLDPLRDRILRLEAPDILSLSEADKGLQIGDETSFDWPLQMTFNADLPPGLALWTLPWIPPAVDYNREGLVAGPLDFSDFEAGRPGSLSVQLRRRDFFAPSGGTYSLPIRVFYRGRWFEYGHGLGLTLAPIQRKIEVRLRTERPVGRAARQYRAVFKDQFEKNGNFGALHPGGEHPYYLEITNIAADPKEPMTFLVTRQLGDSAPITEPITLTRIEGDVSAGGPNQAATFGHHSIKYSDIPSESGVLNLNVSVAPADQPEDARELKFEFRAMKIEDYLEVSPGIIGNVFCVTVTRKGREADPIEHEVGVRVTVGNTSPNGRDILPYRVNALHEAPGRPPTYILLHGESARFCFPNLKIVPGGMISYRVESEAGNIYPTRPWPVPNDATPSAPAPAPAEAGFTPPR